MDLPLLLATILVGLAATGVMVFFLYLPRLWQGEYFDVLNALGSAITRKVDENSLLLGSVIYFGGGIVFAFFYCWTVRALLQIPGDIALPTLTFMPGSPVEINLFFPLLGLVLGLGHGILVALLTTIVVIEHHPLERFRTRYILVLSQLISHLAFGVTAMFLHSQFLQPLLLGSGA